MKLKLSDLWRWNGTINRAQYVLWGALLFAIKYSLDRFVLRIAFDRDWSVADYFRGSAPFQAKEPAAQAPILLALSLPFLWAGTVLTLRRLRSIQRPLWLVALFVMPVLKWFLFAALAILPARTADGPSSDRRTRTISWLDRLIPEQPLGSALLGLGVSLVLAVGATALGAQFLRVYGWGLFVGTPFAMGFITVLIYGYHRPRSFGDCMVAALLAVACAGAGLLAFAFEGIICLLMAAPLAGGVALIGGAMAYFIQAGRREDTPKLACAAFLTVPMLLGLEHWKRPPAPVMEVRTTVEVNANPSQVWQHVIAFADLPEPTEWLFRLGIAYPKRAEIRGQGPGAVRHCVFSTGAFVEPIEIWEEPRLLRFAVTQNPAPMQEWTPYHHVHPPHLDGFLVSTGGQFSLEALPGGGTRLEGTTWYYHHLWPASYWQLWSDFIIHCIHQRVLNHIKTLAEHESKGGFESAAPAGPRGIPSSRLVHLRHVDHFCGDDLSLRRRNECESGLPLARRRHRTFLGAENGAAIRVLQQQSLARTTWPNRDSCGAARHLRRLRRDLFGGSLWAPILRVRTKYHEPVHDHPRGNGEHTRPACSDRRLAGRTVVKSSDENDGYSSRICVVGGGADYCRRGRVRSPSKLHRKAPHDSANRPIARSSIRDTAQRSGSRTLPRGGRKSDLSVRMASR
ncbi:MAG: hypothetical protein FJ398_24980, partial [Verrucomicrobia bacterium]|nr:hypothetical protein [Verrucomicrobiota bacterium]